MNKKQPARLNRCNAHEVLEKQLTISVKEIIFTLIFCIIFVGVIILMTPQTYGFL